MRILVFGNINAGKSYCIESISLLLPKLPVLRIDDYRRRFGDGTFEGDERAIAAFVMDVAANFSCIAECTGLGPLGRRLHSALDPKSSIILKVDAKLDVCLERIAQKDFSVTPYPPFQETLPDTLARCHKEFMQGDLEDLWKDKALWIFTIDGEKESIDFSALPFDQLRALSSLSAGLRSNHFAEALIWYGSGPRGQMTTDSDVDLFLLTGHGIEEIEKYLKSVIPDLIFTDTLKNKLSLRFSSDLLVEITCGNDLSDLDYFYSESGIIDTAWSVLIGDVSVKSHLDLLVKSWRGYYKDAPFLISEAFYYFCSLEALARKGDRYKFYFHANILLHDILRLKALTAGDDHLNYLPPYGLEILGDDAKVIVFSIEQDMTEYVIRMRSYFRQMLNSLKLPDLSGEKYLTYLKHLEDRES